MSVSVQLIHISIAVAFANAIIIIILIKASVKVCIFLIIILKTFFIIFTKNVIYNVKLALKENDIIAHLATIIRVYYRDSVFAIQIIYIILRNSISAFVL